LLMQAAQRAAEADGVPIPSMEQSSALAPDPSHQSSLAETTFSSQDKDVAKAQAMERARNAIAAAAQQANAAALKPSTTPVIRKSPAPVSAHSHGGGGGKKKGPPLRRGKWTAEEEGTYAFSIAKVPAAIVISFY
jgi:hypothetical protein